MDIIKILQREIHDLKVKWGEMKEENVALQGFKKMVRDIRNIEQAMGGHEKEIQESEIPIFKKLSKSIVSAVDISKGESITLDKITTKGPGTGISPMKIDALVGKVAKIDIPLDTVILEENIDW